MKESESEPPLQEYDANGVDRTLVRQTLAMTPAERVRTHDALLADVERLASAGKAARGDRPKDKLMVLQVQATLNERRKKSTS